MEFAGGPTPSRSGLAAMDSAPASGPSFSGCLRSSTIREARTASALAIVCVARERGRSPDVFCQIFVGRFGVSFSPFERLFLGRFGFGQSCGLSVIA